MLHEFRPLPATPVHPTALPEVTCYTSSVSYRQPLSTPLHCPKGQDVWGDYVPSPTSSVTQRHLLQVKRKSPYIWNELPNTAQRITSVFRSVKVDRQRVHEDEHEPQTGWPWLGKKQNDSVLHLSSELEGDWQGPQKRKGYIGTFTHTVLAPSLVATHTHTHTHTHTRSKMSYCRRLRSLLLRYLCYVLPALINSLVCWQCISAGYSLA